MKIFFSSFSKANFVFVFRINELKGGVVGKRRVVVERTRG